MARRRHFPDGIELPSHKTEASSRPLGRADAPALAIVALDQGSGTEAEPVVRAGDAVCVGSRLARPAAPSAVAIHSPVAGRVRSVELRETGTSAGRCRCVLVDNDGSDAALPGMAPLHWESLAPEALVSAIREAGIAGFGGAAFPTATKLSGARRHHAGHLVLNGAECEPWICCDDVLMRERAADVVQGARVLLHASGAERCTIAVEDDKPEAAAAITAAIAEAGDARIAFRPLLSAYPAGAERQVVAAVCGVEVPRGELPQSAGVLCQNVGTAAAVAAFVASGRPSLTRICTVTGSAVRRPANVEARIGTPVGELVRACGGYSAVPARLIAGGSMTGRALSTDAAPLTQAMNCVLAATAADLVPHGAQSPCIRCGDCADVCPAGLLPQQLHRGVVAGDPALLERHGLADCIECGCCDYVCPSRIPLTEGFRVARVAARRRDEDHRRASEARERHRRHEERLAESADAERREFEEARRQARGGD
jgi:electron transport complex protein RnfC